MLAEHRIEDADSIEPASRRRARIGGVSLQFVYGRECGA
jgi:hypothetical protein